MSYHKNYAEWENNPISFWEDKAKNISWIKPWEKTLFQKNYISNGFISGN